MGRIAMSAVDYADVQGLVRFGYGHLTRASYALVRVKNVAAAKAWLRSAPVTSAMALKPPPKTAINIAFTAPGLRALGVPESVITSFSHEFRGGMAEESRARQLGDVQNNAPSNWAWGSCGREPHAVIMFFAEPEQFDFFAQSAKGNTWSDAFEEVGWLATSNLDGDEPFGFADGISHHYLHRIFSSYIGKSLNSFLNIVFHHTHGVDIRAAHSRPFCMFSHR